MELFISAGGVVFYGNSILMLKKLNGEWVLPKGKQKENELIEETAIREVREETKINAKLLQYIDQTSYQYKNYWTNNKVRKKVVNWYLMEAINTTPSPQRDEGFIDARFIHIDKVEKYASYDDERLVIQQAKKIIASR
jgi:8-oxo-dGTP pyrophosphatase MutT (NUDIX family)